MSECSASLSDAQETHLFKRKAAQFTIDGHSNGRSVKRRASKACQCCRARKVRCNVTEHGAPCTNCRLDEVECIVSESRRKKSVSDDPSIRLRRCLDGYELIALCQWWLFPISELGWLGDEKWLQFADVILGNGQRTTTIRQKQMPRHRLMLTASWRHERLLTVFINPISPPPLHRDDHMIMSRGIRSMCLIPSVRRGFILFLSSHLTHLTSPNACHERLSWTLPLALSSALSFTFACAYSQPYCRPKPRQSAELQLLGAQPQALNQFANGRTTYTRSQSLVHRFSTTIFRAPYSKICTCTYCESATVHQTAPFKDWP